MKGKLKKLIAGAAVLAMAAQFAFVLPASAATIYTQDFTGVADATTVVQGAENGALSIKSDADHDNYLSYDLSVDPFKTTNSRSMFIGFTADTAGKNKYVVEFDAALTAGNGQSTELALTTSNKAWYSNTQNNGIESGYLLKMSTTNSETWSVAGSDKTATLTKGKWYNYQVIVDTDLGFASVTIKDDSTTVLDKAVIGVNGAAKDITGLYVRAGRYYSITNIDNIVVRDAEDTDEFGEVPAEVINTFQFAGTAADGTVLPAQVTPPAEPDATESYYLDLSAVGTLGHNLFTEYPDAYTVDWKVTGLAQEDGYINIYPGGDENTNLTTSDGDTITGSKATKLKIDVRQGVSNWFAQIQATLHFTDEDGEEHEATTTRKFAVLAASASSTQFFPAPGYPAAANDYKDDLVGYKSGMTGIDARDTLMGWSIYGGNGEGYIELAKEEGGDKYFDFTTGTGTGSTVAEVNIGNITNEFVIDTVMKFSGNTNWGYYNTTPNNGNLESAFTFDYAGGKITSGDGEITELANDTWYNIIIDCNRSAGVYSITVKDETGDTKGTIEGTTGAATATLKYFASSLDRAANTHRYIKSCRMYYPTAGTVQINSTGGTTVAVPALTEEQLVPETFGDNDEFTYNRKNHTLDVSLADATTAKLYVAEYNGTKLSNVSAADLTFANGKATAPIRLPKTSTIYVWGGDDNMKPLTDATEFTDDKAAEDATLDLTAAVTSIDGIAMTSGVEWSINPSDDDAISIESTGAQSATLTVKEGAPGGPVEVTAKCGTVSVTTTITLTTTGNSISVTQQTPSITIPFTGEPDVTAVYAAKTVDKDGHDADFALDADGNKTTTPAAITYTVLDSKNIDITNNMPTGVTFDATTGTLTVTSAAKPMKISIVATNNDAMPLSRAIPVNIHGLSFAFGSGAPADETLTLVGLDAYNDRTGYGFVDTSALTLESADVKGTGEYTFKVKVPNGNYKVQLTTSSASIKSEKVEGIAADAYITQTAKEFNVAVVDDVLDLTFESGSTLSQLVVTQLTIGDNTDKPELYAIGDSTTNSTNPGFSWGNYATSADMTLPDNIKAFYNHGKAGDDSVVYYNAGRVQNVLLSIKKGDYVTVNMGINSKTAGEPASYYTLLDKYYVEGIIQRGAIPVIVTATPQGPVNGHEGNYTGTTFNCNRGTAAHNGDLRKIAQTHDLNIIELGYWGDQYFNSLTVEDAQAAGKTTVLELVQSWYPDHNHYKQELGKKIAEYITDCVSKIIGGSTEFNQGSDPHIGDQ